MTHHVIERPIGFRPAEISALINWTVVEQHAEEASFQWILRDAAVSAPHYTLQNLADLDERVEANLDGLRISGEAGWQICEAALARNDPGEVFAAAVLAFGDEKVEPIKRTVAVGCSATELQRALISALGWLDFDRVKGIIKGLFLSRDPQVCRVGIAAAAAHRKDPGSVLVDAVGSDDVSLRARAMKAAGELGRIDLLRHLLAALDDHDARCRFHAAWSAARLGERGMPVLRVLHDHIEHPRRYAERAVDIVVRCLDLERAKAWFRRLLSEEKKQRLAARVAGDLGDPELVPELIAMMAEPALARVAGEALSTITGVDLALEDLEGEEPEGFVAGPTDAAGDEDTVPDPDLDLPWPDSELVTGWWTRNSARFPLGHRYLTGRAISRAALGEVLRQGWQRQRLAAALELAMLDRDAPMFEARAPGWRQQRLLRQ